MQTSAHPTTPDLLELALEQCARRHERERQYLVSLAPRVADIHATLDALQAAGLLVIAQDISIFEGDIAVQAVCVAAAREWAHRHLSDARFELQTEGLTTPVSVWKHADGWALCIAWVPGAAAAARHPGDQLAA